MYQSNGIYYTEEHSVSFAPIGSNSYVNTWTDWHLIPSSRPSIGQAAVDENFIEVPGEDGSLDTSDYFGNTVTYSNRKGTLDFIIANGFDAIETVRENMIKTLHGKYMKMKLHDDPNYTYQGFFKVGNLTPSAMYTSITIEYELQPYKTYTNGSQRL